LLLGGLITPSEGMPTTGAPAESLWASPSVTLPLSNPLATVKLLEAIRPGMDRSAVESLLKQQDDGPQTLETTRYYQDPGYLILVPYDESGGLWSPHNRVNGLVKLTHGRWGRIKSSKL
jgi:hypothetical protein